MLLLALFICYMFGCIIFMISYEVWQESSEEDKENHEGSWYAKFGIYHKPLNQ